MWASVSEAKHSISISNVPVMSITVLRRRMFSRRAPMQPQKVMKNMTTPTTIRMTAGSIRNVSRTVSGTKTGTQQPPFRYLSSSFPPFTSPPYIYFSTLLSNLFLSLAPFVCFSVLSSYTGCLHSLNLSMTCCGLCRIQRRNQWDEPRLILFVVHLLCIRK